MWDRAHMRDHALRQLYAAEARNVQADEYAEKNFYVKLRVGGNEVSNLSAPCRYAHTGHPLTPESRDIALALSAG